MITAFPHSLHILQPVHVLLAKAIPIAWLLEKHVSTTTVVHPEHARFSCDVQSCSVALASA